MENEYIGFAVVLASAICVALVLYGAWLCLEYTLDEDGTPRARKIAKGPDERPAQAGFGDANPK